MKTNISLVALEKLTEIFNKNGWSIEDHREEYDRFCQALEHFSPEQQGLIFELTREFLWVTLNKYESYLYASLFMIEKKLLVDCNKIYILPLQSYPEKRENETRNESAIFTRYLIKISHLSNNDLFRGKKICLIDSPLAIPKDINFIPAMLILVDDFIGSGETGETAVKDMCRLAGITDYNKILVVSLVAQEMGVQRLSRLGIRVFSRIIRKRGISDSYLNPERETKSRIMESIESLIKVKKKYNFGYNRTEALVAMMSRTPNNTFPVYWCENSMENGKKFIAPFSAG
ncbi:MAG: hypothetical protein WCY09_01775 [Candidatus Omnitrophota bacterium]